MQDEQPSNAKKSPQSDSEGGRGGDSNSSSSNSRSGSQSSEDDDNSDSEMVDEEGVVKQKDSIEVPLSVIQRFFSKRDPLDAFLK